MAVSLKHSKTSAKADGADTGLVQPSDWNAEHVLTQATNTLLGRTTAGTGATEEISVGSGLTFGAGSLSANVTSVAGRTGAVTIAVADVSDAAPLASPALTGTPTAPTAAADTNTTQLATTAYVVGQGYLKSATASSTYAPLASPTFTGTATFATASFDGNITITGASRRITGDFSNATIASRLLFQDATTNNLTSVGVIPNGTNQFAYFQLFNSSTPDNSSFLNFTIGSSAALISSDKIGTGSYMPLLINVGGSEQMRVTTAGNLGIGTNAPATKLDINGGIATNVVAVAASAIDCSLGNVFTKTASGALTWTVTNVPASRSFTIILELTNGGTGTQTWFSGIKWPAGTAPTLTTSGVDVLGFFTDDGGTNWRGVLLMKDSK